MEFIPRFPCNCLHVFFSNIGAFHIFRWDFQSKNTTGPPWYFTPPVTDGLRCRWMLAAAGGGNFSSQDMVNEGMMTPPNPTSKDELGKHIWQKFCFWEISSFNFFLEWFGWDSGVRCFLEWFLDPVSVWKLPRYTCKFSKSHL